MISAIPIPSANASAIRLFACISRFEFALKEASFITGPEGGNAAPDWPKFEHLAARQRAFAELCSMEETRVLVEEPPRKQLRRGDFFEWGEPLLVRDIHELTVAIRQVRNNLFHGGKSGADPRDDALCDAAVAALLFLVDVDPRIRAAFVGEY